MIIYLIHYSRRTGKVYVFEYYYLSGLIIQSKPLYIHQLLPLKGLNLLIISLSFDIQRTLRHGLRNTYLLTMTEIERLIKVGKELSLSGDELRSWAENQLEMHTEKERLNHERLRIESELELKKINDETALNEQKRLVAEKQLELLSARRDGSDQASEVSSVELESSSAPPRIQLPRLPVFQETTDDISVYLDRFEKYVLVNGFAKETHAMVLSTYLKGSALEVFHRLSVEDSKKYDVLKTALLKRYQVTADRSRKQFREVRRHKDESYTELRNRLEKDLSKWIEMAGVSKDKPEDLWELMMKEQFLANCSPELRTYIADRDPKSCNDMAKIADRYDEARRMSSASAPKPSVKTLEHGAQPHFDRRNKDSMQNRRFCKFCKKYGHSVDRCSYKPMHRH